ncbi:hypothetical protein VCHA37P191_120043 [Vibrio chagasii]|nr:hypothetical protein VCHA37P191_120043 [Vibrio chagasii]CAH6949456.1 hypothetical protein VCHA49P380_130043 [Vibrio chagasii]
MSLFNTNTVNLIDIADHKERNRQIELVSLFESAVKEIEEALADGVVMVVPISHGKDSSLTMCIVLTAYKRAIAGGLIEPDRPLISYNTNTGGEAIVMNMFSNYAGKKLTEYASSVGINLLYAQNRPVISDEFFIRWASASKLIPSPLRAGDCSVILKLDTANAYLKSVTKILDPKYQTLCVAVGSRTMESTRRKMNIKKQKLSDKYETVHSTAVKQTLLKMAPIVSLTDDDVFELLALIGTNPITKRLVNVSFESYFDNFGLLLELYGNAKNDACELAIGANNTSGCSGTARFGCWYCTMSKTDKSGSETAKYPRYKILGAESALRVRDWLFRVGHDNSKRALHSKAYDEVVFNRILLQPNILKSTYLEKMVWYASQLTLDSHKAAAEFREYERSGNLHNHAGYKDILEDNSIHPKTKKSFLEMYREEAGKPQFEVFSEKHAVLLSAKWAIDGITSNSYKPLNIFHRVQEGEAMPYPKLNSELEAIGVQIKMDRNLPNIVAIKTMNESNLTPIQYLNSGVKLEDLYELPTHINGTTQEQSHNCTIAEIPATGTELKAHVECSLSTSSLKSESTVGYFFTSFGGIYVNLDSFSIDKVTSQEIAVTNKLKQELTSQLLENSQNYLVDYFEDLECNTLQLSDSGIQELLDKSVASLNEGFQVKFHLPYITGTEVGHLPRVDEVKSTRRNERSPRVLHRKGGLIQRGNSRVKSYPINLEPMSSVKSIRTVDFLNADFSTSRKSTRICTLSTISSSNDDLLDFTNIDFNEDMYELWKLTGGLNRALLTHDDEVKQQYLTRRERPINSFRRYNSYNVINTLFGEAGLFVKKSYQKTFESLLRRTCLYSEIGAYDLANMKHRDLVTKPYAIDMKTHRSNKAHMLMEIRKVRNSKRNGHKRLKAQSSYTPELFEMLNKFVELQIHSAGSALTLGFEGRANCVFFDNPVSLVERSNCYMTLGYIHNEHFSSPSALIKKVFGIKTANHLKKNDEYRKFNSMIAKLDYKKLTSEISKDISHYRSCANELEGLIEILERGEGSIQDARGVFNGLMKKYHKNTDRYLDTFFDNKQNTVNLMLRCKDIISHINKSSGDAIELIENVTYVIKTANKNGLNSLSLSQRLKAMA